MDIQSSHINEKRTNGCKELAEGFIAVATFRVNVFDVSFNVSPTQSSSLRFYNDGKIILILCNLELSQDFSLKKMGSNPIRFFKQVIFALT